MTERRPLRVNGQPIPKEITDGPAGAFARYCGETNPRVLAMLDAEDEREAAVREAAVTAVIRALVRNSALPEWMRMPALGQDMRPLAELVVDALRGDA